MSLSNRLNGPFVTRKRIARAKKWQTIKVQLLIFLLSLTILSVIYRKGAIHDFRILKESRLPLQRAIAKLGDAGYQGFEKLYENSQTPIKKTKKRPLTAQDIAYNRALARKRIRIEHVNRRCKIFRITKDTYRGKHKHYGKTWNVVVALVNLRYDTNPR